MWDGYPQWNPLLKGSGLVPQTNNLKDFGNYININHGKSTFFFKANRDINFVPLINNPTINHMQDILYGVCDIKRFFPWATGYSPIRFFPGQLAASTAEISMHKHKLISRYACRHSQGLIGFWYPHINNNGATTTAMEQRQWESNDNKMQKSQPTNAPPPLADPLPNTPRRHWRGNPNLMLSVL